MIRIESVLLRREIRANWIDARGQVAYPIIVWQTQVDGGGWRINGLTVGTAYYRPSKDGQWPMIIPAELIMAVVQLDPNRNTGTVSPNG
jgi:hypothetical protein